MCFAKRMFPFHFCCCCVFCVPLHKHPTLLATAHPTSPDRRWLKRKRTTKRAAPQCYEFDVHRFAHLSQHARAVCFTCETIFKFCLVFRFVGVSCVRSRWPYVRWTRVKSSLMSDVTLLLSLHSSPCWEQWKRKRQSKDGQWLISKQDAIR